MDRLTASCQGVACTGRLLRVVSRATATRRSVADSRTSNGSAHIARNGSVSGPTNLVGTGSAQAGASFRERSLPLTPARVLSRRRIASMAPLSTFFALTKSGGQGALYQVSADFTTGSQPAVTVERISGPLRLKGVHENGVMAKCRLMVGIAIGPLGGLFCFHPSARDGREFWEGDNPPVFQSSTISALFLVRETAEWAVSEMDFCEFDSRWQGATTAVIVAIGVDHPAFVVLPILRDPVNNFAGKIMPAGLKCTICDAVSGQRCSCEPASVWVSESNDSRLR